LGGQKFIPIVNSCIINAAGEFHKGYIIIKGRAGQLILVQDTYQPAVNIVYSDDDVGGRSRSGYSQFKQVRYRVEKQPYIRSGGVDACGLEVNGNSIEIGSRKACSAGVRNLAYAVAGNPFSDTAKYILVLISMRCAKLI
jgi:hypothetical protein